MRLGGRPRDLLAWMCTLAPAGLIAFLLVGHAVDTLYMDDWDLLGTTLLQARSGQLGWSQLVAQHNESRPLVPRLLFLVVGTAAGGDSRWLLAASFGLACLVSYSIFQLARATFPAGLPQTAVLGFVANLLIFTPKQAETWLWPTYVGLEPIACFAATLALLHGALAPWKKVVGSAVLCTIATFSYANGLSTWLLAAPVVAMWAGRRWMVGWTAGLLLNAGLYFHGYVQPAGLPLAAAPLRGGFQPLLLTHYVLVFLGASLAANKPMVAAVTGAALLAAFMAVGLYALRHARDEGLLRRLLPWLAMGGYSIVAAIAAAIGRSNFGAEHALVNRYVPFSLYLVVALGFAVPLVLKHARGVGSALRWWWVARAVAVLGLAVVLALHSASALAGVEELIREGRMLRYGRSCLAFVLVRRDDRCLGDWVYPDAASVTERARELDRLGLLHPRLVQSARLQETLILAATPETAGVFEQFVKRGVGYVARGWAVSPGSDRPADAVVLARERPDGSWVPLGFAPVLRARPDVARARGAACRDSGFRGDLARDDLRPWPVRVGAWSFDLRTGRAVRVKGVFTVEEPVR